MNTLQTQRDNTAFLLTGVIPWMLANPDRVDLGLFNSECGTLGCVLGWYSLRRHNQTYNDRCTSTCEMSWEFLEFGMPRQGIWASIFGHELEGSLEERIPRIQAHLDDLNLRIATE